MTQPELALADAVSQFDSGDGNGCCCDGLEAVHGPASSLDGPMVLLDFIVELLAGSDLDLAPEESLTAQQPEGSPARDVAVECDLPGTAAEVGGHGFAKEGLSGGNTPVGAEQEIDRLALPIDRAILVKPFPTNLDLRFIDPPGTASRSAPSVPALLKYRDETLDPAPDRRGIEIQTAVGHHLGKITQP